MAAVSDNGVAEEFPADSFRFSIDRGGTFTDIYAEVPGRQGRVVMKLLSEDTRNYPDAPREGIRRILESVTGQRIAADAVPTRLIQWIRMGTTVATNALLERKGAPTLLLVTKGLQDVLRIGNQSRPRIFDLTMRKPGVLYQQAIEVDERVRVLSNPQASKLHHSNEVLQGTAGNWVEVLKAPDLGSLRPQLEAARETGIESVAVALMHSYTFPQHERAVGELCKELGFTQISLSSTVPMKKLVPRGQTSTVDAYLSPLIRLYLDGFRSGFDDPTLATVDVSFMMSDGGLCPMDEFYGYSSILSGPAGGVVGFARTTYDAETRQPVIGFDMGGTSTDVSRYDGLYSHVYDTETAGITVQAPQLDIKTIAAGGGSELSFHAGMFKVGPESVGSEPGPVCYRKGGKRLAVTDANLFLGRIIPKHFPHIFGPGEDQPLDLEATTEAFQQLTNQVNQALILQGKEGNLTPEQVAKGFLDVANTAMARPIRNITEAKGFSAGDHVLAAFGGAGPQHACSIARMLGMRKVFVHKYSGILSAFGLGLADIAVERAEPAAEVYGEESWPRLSEKLERLKKEAEASLEENGFKATQRELQVFFNLRYDRTDTAIMTLQGSPVAGEDSGGFLAPFLESYEREFGFLSPGKDIIVDDVRVRGVGKAIPVDAATTQAATDDPKIVEHTRVFFGDAWVEAAVYDMEQLKPGHTLKGPAIILNQTSTIVVDPQCTVTVSSTGDLELDIGGTSAKKIGPEWDSIRLSVFEHRFMSIAEQMGKTLQRTSISTNIKERLDFSCALFGPDGGLVANAPHLPVHLGAMQWAVRWQMEYLGEGWKEGEVIVTNHPQAGGSHLPDITVITPCYHEGTPVFYVASRGHHSDIGGISPGSMPPFSKSLEEEGARIKSFKLVKDGVFQEEGIASILLDQEVHGTRCLSDNVSDLKAQCSANHKGVQLVSELIAEYGLATVQAYMGYVQDNAEEAVRTMLVSIARKHGLGEVGCLKAMDFMDDGSCINLCLTIDSKKRTAVFDFSGSSNESYGNCNAPRAVTYSAIIYSLRCLVEDDIPLNQGCLNPIEVILPEGSLLAPSESAAVVGGNVLTSQRVTDVVLSAFGACACSQGCMNNLTFGNSSMGYYETIAGGSGAGPTWDGEHGVHSHMTNTRITDPEVLESRYPVIVRTFSLRKGSGGSGQHQGGDGVVRELELLEPLNVGILSERRSLPPPGCNGGMAGARGVNTLIKSSGRRVNLGPKNEFSGEVGDRICLETPGGGGFGAVASK